MAFNKRAWLVAAALCATSAVLFAERPAAPVACLLSAPFSGGGMRGSGQGFLGVGTRTVGDPAISSLHLKETHGACVVIVDHDSPAWKAGIREHDVLFSVNGAAVDSEEQLTRMLRDLPPGHSAQIVLSRDGATQTVTATMADRDEVGRLAWEQHFVVPAPADIPDDTAVPPPLPKSHAGTFGHGFVSGHLLPGGAAYTGAVVDEIGPQLSEYFGLKTNSALLVHSVDANSPAALAGLHAGDVVCRVNGQNVASRGDWTHALRDSKGHPVSVTVLREHHEQTLTLVPNGKRRSEVEAPGDTEHRWYSVLLVHPSTR